MRIRISAVNIFCFVALLRGLPAIAAEGDALAIDANIQSRHFLYGQILDPMFAAIGSQQIATYTRCGDAALWTGLYLAAEAFRYGVTQSPDALQNVKAAVGGLHGLVAVTGNNLLARCMVPIDSPYAQSIASQEAANGIHTNASAGWIWVGNTSRDEYCGALFGLTVAYDMVNDPELRNSISTLITLMIEYVQTHNWAVEMPDGSSSTSFLGRPDQIETLLAIGRHVNSNHFSGISYDVQRQLFAAGVPVPVALDTTSDDSYFKFNLDYINLYNLVRIEASVEKSIYQAAYASLRDHTASHQNAFFNVIDLALNGKSGARDAQTLALLDAWLLRARRDFTVDLSSTVPVCGSQACAPVPVERRPNTDFLWQRSPFDITGYGFARIETAGIDYILPYWMARYYGVTEANVMQSSAAPAGVAAPGSLATIYGTNLASTNAKAMSLPLPENLGGVHVMVQDRVGNTAGAGLLYVSPGQINLLMPDGLVTGVATFTIDNGSGTPVTAIGAVGQVAPAIFTVTGTGSGGVAANAVSGTSALDMDQAIDVADGTPVYLTLYGTGIRNRSALQNVSVSVNGLPMPVFYAGSQPDFAGLDQVNIQLTPDLQGSGIAQIVVTVDERESNVTTINIR